MGNATVTHHCCIHDSRFKDIEDVNSDKEVEKAPFLLLDKTIERCESVINDLTPSRKSSKSRVDD